MRYAFRPALIGPAAGHGVDGLVFQAAFPLPAQSLLGPGLAVRRAIGAMQPPQVWHRKAAPVAGLGGTVRGQMALQPLAIPPGS